MAHAATRSDWKNLPMPAQRAELSVDLTFNDAEFQKLAAGFVPEEMEDRWFIFYERQWLYLHRSWTGVCVYQVRFECDAGQHRVVEAIANRDTEQYRPKSEARDALQLKIQLFGRVGRDCEMLWQEFNASPRLGATRDVQRDE